MTMINKIMVSMRPKRDRAFSFKLVLGPFGARAGFAFVQMTTAMMNSIVKRSPGMIPAMKSFPMDCSVMMP